ncbi:MAG: MAPEG family protein [Gammaproteobacteria bacterium]|jgi:hypothetical protein|nr:MAPEG family protein [Gammaproteobacteria bacterium]MBT5052474.1 MAPEG family protein [Gammaproteobacteria bacterium]
MNAPILAPAAILILWSLIMLVWMVATRLPALPKAGLDLSGAGGRGQDIDPQLPPITAWKSHNYAHLMEQPTLFYAVVVLLTLVGQGDGLNAQLAWAYVSIRIAHSLWQALVNTIPLRFGLFVLSTLCLFALSLQLVMATLS